MEKSHGTSHNWASDQTYCACTFKTFSNILETKCGLLKEVVANSTLLDLNIQNMEMLYVLNTDMLLYAGKKLCEI
jgi:hypothetical protein